MRFIKLADFCLDITHFQLKLRSFFQNKQTQFQLVKIVLLVYPLLVTVPTQQNCNQLTAPEETSRLETHPTCPKPAAIGGQEMKNYLF